MLNKVPEVTLYFWIIKVLCTTVGETAADFLNDNLGLGLTKTTFVTGAVLVVALVFQFRVRRYVPGIYWLAVVLISVVGTLITDNLTDNFGVSLVTTTVVFSIVLAAVFAAWYASERTLSIHTIVTTRREAFYWLTVLFTFALGTAAGDLTAERLAVGYWKSALLFAALIGIVYVLHLKAGLNAILAFWIAYILTRPLGASIGDYLSQPRADGGLGLGTTVTSVVFLLTILAVVVYLSVTKVDLIEGEGERRSSSQTRRRRVGPRRHEQAGGDAGARRGCAGAGRNRSGRVPRARPESQPPGLRPRRRRTPKRPRKSSRQACRRWSRRREPRSTCASPTARMPSTTSWPRWTPATTTRSSSRPRRATSRTGSMSTSRSASPTSAIRCSRSLPRTRAAVRRAAA